MSEYCVDVEVLIEGGNCWGVLGVCLGWGEVSVSVLFIAMELEFFRNRTTR